MSIGKCAPMPSAEVKSYPGLNLAALNYRHEGPYRLWLLARHLDREGSGRVSARELRRFVRDNLGVTRQTLIRWFKAGDDLFWYQRDEERLHLRSLFFVADFYGVRLQPQPVRLSLDTFANLSNFRAALVGSFFAKRPKTISQATLANLTGKTARTVRRYLERIEGLQKQHNAMISERAPSCAEDPDYKSRGYFLGSVGGKQVLLKYLPATYYAPGELCAFGMVKKHRKVTSLSTAGGAMPERCFYGNPKAASRRLNGLQEGETIFILHKKPLQPSGCRLWRGFTQVNGGLALW